LTGPYGSLPTEGIKKERKKGFPLSLWGKRRSVALYLPHRGK